MNKDRDLFKLEVGQRITDVREEMYVSRLELEHKTGKPTQNIANIEAGAVDFETSTLYILAMGIGVSMSYLADIDKTIKKKKQAPFHLTDMEPEEALKMIRLRIKRIRLEKEMPGDKVSKKFDHGRQWLEKIENGEGDIRIYTLYKIACGLGITLPMLLDIHDEHTKEKKK